MEKRLRAFKALVWIKGESTQPERLTLTAHNLAEAENQLREKFGAQIEFSLYNEEDANMARVPPGAGSTSAS